jgi:hypothetical protein
MREELLGYLLGALEPEEERELEARLADDASLREELEELRHLVEPLADETVLIDPPAGLAARVCDQVWYHAEAARSATLSAASRWTRSEIATLLGIFCVVGVLAVPIVGSVRHLSQIRTCQFRLHGTGRSLIDYARLHDDYFPEVAEYGNAAHAGIFAVRLQEAGLMAESQAAYCPAAVAGSEIAPLPTLRAVHDATPAEADLMFAGLGGLFGYVLGYDDEGRYRRVRNRHRANFAVLADGAIEPGTAASNHGCGQNMWFEDGHVAFLNACRLPASHDDFYRNRAGFVAAGIGPDDVVIGCSRATPRLTAAVVAR